MRFVVVIFFGLLALLDHQLLDIKSWLRMMSIESIEYSKELIGEFCNTKTNSSNLSKAPRRIRVKLFFEHRYFSEIQARFVTILNRDTIVYRLSAKTRGISDDKCVLVDSQGFVFGKVVEAFNRTIKVIPYHSPLFATGVYVQGIDMSAFAQSVGKGMFTVSFAEEIVPKGRYLVYPLSYSGIDFMPFVLGYISQGQRPSIMLQGVFASSSRYPRVVSLVCR